MLKQIHDPAETVSDVVFRQIREDIISGVLPPGAKIKLEQAKERYSIGISSLREILSRLTTENLVLAEGQRGFEVSPASRRELLELADLRIVLETHDQNHFCAQRTESQPAGGARARDLWLDDAGRYQGQVPGKG